MAKIIARLSGVVSYYDGKTKQFSVYLDEKGNIAVNHQADSIQAFWDAIGAGYIPDLLSHAGAKVLVVTTKQTTKPSDVVLEITGRLADDNGTAHDFFLCSNYKIGCYRHGFEHFIRALKTNREALTELFRAATGSPLTHLSLFKGSYQLENIEPIPIVIL